MIFLEEILPPVHEVFLSMTETIDVDKDPTIDDVIEWRKTLRDAVLAIDERTFIIMTAQIKGWGFAKELDFYQSGGFFMVFSVIDWFGCIGFSKCVCFSGEKSDKNFEKVAKRQLKREEDKKTPSKRKFVGSRPFGYQPIGYQQPSTSGWAPVQVQAPPPVYQFQSPPPPFQPKGPSDKSRMRCNNCRELGHFFRECTKPLAYAK